MWGREVLGAGLDWCFITTEQLVVLFLEQRNLAAGAYVHRCVEAGVLAASAALGRHFVVELVFDLHHLAFADLAEVEGDDHLSGFAVVDYACGDFRQGVSDLAGERAAVEFFEEFGGIGWSGDTCFSDWARSPLGGS